MHTRSYTYLLSLALLFGAPLLSAAADSSQCVPPGDWKNAKLQTVSSSKVVRALAKNHVVLLGEDHENAEHHRWQLQTIAKLHALQPDIALAFESFPRSAQPVLDMWVQGKLTEQALLKQTDWESVWTYNADFYLPMFHFARMHRIPMIAMNVDRTLVSEVGKKGWANIPAAERQGITDPASAPEDYIDSLVDIFSQHMPSGGHGHDQSESEDKQPDREAIVSSPMFKNFLQSQLLWDRAMAEAIHKQAGQSSLVVGIVGAGHIMGGWGIPHQLKDLGTRQVATAMPWDGVIECEQLQNGLVHWAFGIEQRAKSEGPARPKLGIYLEPAKQGVGVNKIVPGSIAEQLGIQAGDRVIEIAGRPVTKVSDIITTVQSTGWGTWLPLVVQRKKQRIELVAKFPPQP